MTDSETTYDPETGGRDMIDLGPSPREAEASPTPELPEGEDLSAVTEKIVAALKTVYDPEIPVDIYELGLIYRVDYEAPGDVKILMTLTAPGCPVAGEMPQWVEQAIMRVDDIRSCEVDMTFEPPWSPDRMSDEARLELGWM
jgi:FeS assembly SUF system protein